MPDFQEILKAEPAFGDVHTPSAMEAPAKPPKKKVFGENLATADADDVIKYAPTVPRQLKPMDEHNSFSPFPFDPMALSHIRPDQTPRFFAALTDPDKLPMKTVPMDSLVAMQNRVNTGKAQSLVTPGSEPKPPVVVKANGRNYIADGHHRATATWLQGAKSVKCRYCDLEPFSNNLKDWEVPFTVAKAMDEQQMIFGWASVSELDGQLVIDKHGSIILPEDLEAAAYSYMLKSRTQGHMHEEMGIGRCIESMIFTKEKQALMGISFPDQRVGWWIGFKVDNAEHWQAHKRGDLKEFSIGGRGRRIDL